MGCHMRRMAHCRAPGTFGFPGAPAPVRAAATMQVVTLDGE
jgi:hypothetical protein